MEQALRPISLDEINNAAPVSIDLPDDETDETVDVDIEEEYGFDENLAEVLPDSVLSTIASDLLEDIRNDKNSRTEWEKTVTDGMQLLGLKIEERTEPWKGACGVFHSMLAEAVIKFQSEMIMETFPASGPVQTKVIGKPDKDKDAAAERVKEDMNWQLQDNMTEYRPEHERMLWSLGFCGAAFKKVYYDPSLGRQVSMFVSAEDLLIPYGNSDITNCNRLTHVMKKTENELRKLMQAGFYKDLELGEPTREQSDIERKKEKMTGVRMLEETRFTLNESHVELDIPGFEDTDEDGEETGIGLPYVVTLDPEGKVFAIYRNWKEGDEKKLKREHFVQYTFIPGFGPYGWGYVHLLGGDAKGATSIFRQLVDAGTLANLPGGLKSRGLRIKGDDTPIAPGEFRDVDVPAGTIRDNLIPLPYKEPSNTLFLLFKEVVDQGRSLASTADMKVADMNQQAPVGTTLAIIERMMKVMSAVQARVHASMKKEFALLKEIIRDYAPKDYEYDTEGGRQIKQSDYNHVDVLPVSDPNASSTAQRIAQYQAALTLSQGAPQLYDLPELHRETLRALGMKNANKIVPDKQDIKPRDPVMENMNILNGKPVKAFLYQDHKAHLAVHMAAAQDPVTLQIVGQSPLAQSIGQAIQAHMMEHLAFQYRVDIERQMGVNLPDMDEDLPEEIEIRVSRLVAEAAPQILLMHNKEEAQKQIQQQQQDPIIQLQQAELQIKAQEVQRKAAKDQADSAIATQELQIQQQAAQVQLEKAKIDASVKMASAQASAQKSQIDAMSKAQDAQLKRQTAHAQIQKAQADAQKASIDAQTNAVSEAQKLELERERMRAQQRTEEMKLAQSAQKTHLDAGAKFVSEAQKTQLERDRLRAQVITDAAKLNHDGMKHDKQLEHDKHIAGLQAAASKSKSKEKK